MSDTTQVLTEEDRGQIRNDLYGVTEDQPVNLKDGKIKYFTDAVRGKTVLDLGSLDHTFANHVSQFWMFKGLVQSASSVMGLDYYQTGVNEAQAAGYNIVFGDAQAFSFDQKYESITAGDLIEHLPNVGGMFASANAALEDGGTFVLATPNPWCWKYLASHVVHGKLDRINKEHVAWYCPRTIELLGMRYGFELVDFSFTSRRKWELMVPLPKSIKHTTLCLTLRKMQ